MNTTAGQTLKQTMTEDKVNQINKTILFVPSPVSPK